MVDQYEYVYRDGRLKFNDVRKRIVYDKAFDIFTGKDPRLCNSSADHLEGNLQDL